MVDLRRIISETQSYNFHSHTQFCDGRDTIESIARAAADCGMKYFGLSPHSPLPIASPCNMQAADVDAYKAEVARVRGLLKGRCEIFTGMEIDYLSPQWGPASEYFQNLGLDYTIASVHFIPNQTGEYVDIDGRPSDFIPRMAEYFDNDIRYVVEAYYAQSCEMLAAGGFDILGHFDKIGFNASHFRPGIEDEAWYKAVLDDYIGQIIASGVIVEINTKAYEEHSRFFPGERHWKRLLEAGVPLMVNSDAHFADKVNASRNVVFNALRK